MANFCSLLFSFHAVLFSLSRAKTFRPCELAQILLDSEVDTEDVSTWLCIARYESNFNSSAVGHMSGDGSLDHGIFQINDRFWCTDSDDDVMACGVSCRALEDDQLGDDIACARRIFRQHKRLGGNGWLAWAVFPHYCTSKEKNDERFLKNNNCSLNALPEVASTKLQVIPTVNSAADHPIPHPQAHIFNSNFKPSTTASSMMNAQGIKHPSSTIPPASVFNANGFSFAALPLGHSNHPQSSTALNSKYSLTTFPPSLNSPQSSSTHSPASNHHSSFIFTSTPVTPISSTGFPTTPALASNRFDFSPWLTTVRPSSTTVGVGRRFPFSG